MVKWKDHGWAPTATATPLETPCREWQGARLKGYGIIVRAGRNWRVHRWIWTLVNGPIPEGMLVLHRCDNPPCFRLSHLRLGTHADNMRDRDGRDRQSKGSGIARSRLTEADVMEMRERHAAGATGADLAQHYGVGEANVSWIVTGKTWRHVGGPIRTEHGNTKRSF